MDIARLKEKAGMVPDPRRQRGNLRHKPEDILVIGLAALVCDGEDFEGMELFGREREADLKKFLELPGGIPDESAFFRVFHRVEPAELSRYLYEWLAEGQGTEGALINIDGKQIRGSGKGEERAVPGVSAWVGEKELVLGQGAVDEKSNEIKAIPKLLDLLDVKGATITIDAMGCQSGIAKKIREKQANSVFAVKENQPTLYQDVKDYFEGLKTGEIREPPEDVWITDEERGHGRVEQREVRTVTDRGWLKGKETWKDLKTIIE